MTPLRTYYPSKNIDTGSKGQIQAITGNPHRGPRLNPRAVNEANLNITWTPSVNSTTHLKCMLLNCRSAVRHAPVISDLILTHELDLIILIETWVNDASAPILDFLFFPLPRVTTALDKIELTDLGAGSPASTSTLSVKHSQTVALPACNFLCIDITSNNRFICKLDAIYRPLRDNLPFIEQIMEIISTKVDHQVTQIFLGYFNLHWNYLNGHTALKPF